jgi:hypothetical protein
MSSPAALYQRVEYQEIRSLSRISLEKQLQHVQTQKMKKKIVVMMNKKSRKRRNLGLYSCGLP